MNSGLLNLWREVGAYLRYGDAKCIFLSGLSFGLLFSFVRFRLIDEEVTWLIFNALKNADLSVLAWSSIIAFSLAFFVSTIVVIPSSSKRLARVKCINGIERAFSVNGAKGGRGGVIYFRDVATYDSAGAYESALRESMELSVELNAAEKDLTAQIWIISQIAASKFIAAKVAVVAIIIGLVCGFW